MTPVERVSAKAQVGESECASEEKRPGVTRSATKRPPLHDRARAPEQTLRVLPELQRPEVSLKLERQHRDQDWLAP